jgi:hypothetical protein
MSFADKLALKEHLNASGHRTVPKKDTKSSSGTIMLSGGKSAISLPSPHFAAGSSVKRIIRTEEVIIQHASHPLTPQHTTRPLTHRPQPRGVDIAISFDTTGSMYSCLSKVRDCIGELSNKVIHDLPSVRVGLLAHGDYCDKASSYVDKYIQFTRDSKALSDFLSTAGTTSGGDGDECYELVLRRFQHDFRYGQGSRRVAIMFGDANPHEKGYKCSGMTHPLSIDWKEEVEILKKKGIAVYSVHCQPNPCTAAFYRTVAEKTGGAYLTLDRVADNLQDVVDLITAVAMKEAGNKAGLEALHKEAHARKRSQLADNLVRIIRVTREEVSVVHARH